MIRSGLIGLALAVTSLPAMAQDYYATTSNQRHGNGYSPSAIVAGWEGEESFSVISITPDGKRMNGATLGTEWKATVITGPRAEAEDETEEDDRYLDRNATAPKKKARTGPPVPRVERMYSSFTCPAIAPRMEALKPLTGFEFDPPAFKGNQDGPTGDGREGFDLWLRVGGAELSKSAETSNSALAAWFRETERALSACTGTPRTP